ncbi:MAG: CopG family transcriptional regulator [Cyanobacteria bacterium J06628_6]
MNTYTLELRGDLLESAQTLAARSDIPLEQWLLAAIEAKVGVEATQHFLNARASNANYERFDEILSRVPEVPPVEGDEL